MLKIDMNADVGEGMGQDRELMQLISSANIACGFHAGDDDTMKSTVELALENRVAIGAHCSYPDRKNFGRVDLFEKFQLNDLSDIISTQINHLREICVSMGAMLLHVKPHGAMYNRAAREPQLSDCLCMTIAQIDPLLILYGLSGSEMKTGAERHGLLFINEVFADRRYESDGSLTPRGEADAIIHDANEAIAQVLEMLHNRKVRSRQNSLVSIIADSVCVHGDEPDAVYLAANLRAALIAEKVSIVAPLSLAF
jgi:UPF0271 protein